jgi:GNAT superfamily N-acetyltransferase
MIEFKNINDFKPGIIQRLIKESYAQLINYFPGEKAKFYKQWEQEDKDAFDNLQTIGKSLFISCLHNIPIGYCSWDLRQNPVEIIGQNCILPGFQSKGYGTIQIEKIIKIFADNNYKEITVITGDHDFFIPARKIYEKCGFKEQKRTQGELFHLIAYKKVL